MTTTSSRLDTDTIGDGNTAVQPQYTALVRDHGPDMYRYVYASVGNQPLAEDLTQDVFMRAWERLDQLRDVDQARSWLFSIAANLVRDHHRRARLKRWLPLSVLDGWNASSLSYDTDLDLGTIVTQALQQMSPGDRQVLLLVGLMGFTQRELAEILGISDSAAHKRWQRSRDRFLALTYGNTVSKSGGHDD